MGEAKRILLFGGTFDPVHNGHLIVARTAAQRRGSARVMLIPSAVPPHKTAAGASAAHRLAMLELAIEGHGLFEVCELELQRSGVSYTLETVEQLRRRHPDAEFHWLIGADMLPDLHKWYRAQEVVKLVRFVVAARLPWQDQLGPIFQALGDRFPPEAIERLRAGVTDTPLVDISSTDIRRRIAAGEPIDQLVPPAVACYIAAHGLYGGAGGGP